jgi:hypothetical protein
MLHWSISWRVTGGVERENSGDSPEKDSGQGDRRQEVEGRTRIQLRKHHVKRGKTRSGEADGNVADRRLRMITGNEATPFSPKKKQRRLGKPVEETFVLIGTFNG